MSTESRAVSQLSCSSNLCLQQGSRSTFTFCSRLLQKLLCRQRLTFRSRSACKTSFFCSVVQDIPATFFTAVLTAFPCVRLFFYWLPVLYLAGRIDRLPCFGTHDSSRVHTPMLSSLHGTKASISVLPLFFLSPSVFSEPYK